MKIEYMKWITRETVKANADKAFLFGDNGMRKGLGGQAKEMRGEPNAFGIFTKKLPFNNPSAFLTDLDFEANKRWIDLDIQRIMDSGFQTAVIPENGLGTGLAELDKRAPQTFAYLQKKIMELEHETPT